MELLSNDLYCKMYVVYIWIIVQDFFVDSIYLYEGMWMQEWICFFVEVDLNKFYNVKVFEKNFYELVWVNKVNIVGIMEFMEFWREYL